MSRNLRSFGLAAHVDAGKTTLAERILFVTGRVHLAGEIKGDRPTRLDHDTVEIAHGITVSAAATHLAWADHDVVLVDTPGHIDFTVEVERAMAVLDGAVLALCGVAGVQSQTRTVEAQMARYGVPRVVFVNKCDHPAADPVAAVAGLRTRLGVNAALTSLPIGRGPELVGVVDVVHRRAWTFADGGRTAAPCAVPEPMLADVEAAREALVDAVSLVDAALLGAAVAGDVDGDTLSAAIARAVGARTFAPVLVGSAARGIGIQPLLDAVVAWLPPPRPRTGVDPATGGPVPLDLEGPAVAWVFKAQDTRHGVWTWLRVYRGALRAGDALVDGRTGRRHRIGRLGRIDGGGIEPLDVAVAGEIVAAFGLDLPSGTTLCDPAAPVIVGRLEVPEPLVERAVTLVAGERSALSRGLGQLVREDPTLRVVQDDESGETRIRGMGELHLDIAMERLTERTGATVALGEPRVAVRAALAGPAAFDLRLRKQTGGPGMFARLVGAVAPADRFTFRWAITGGAVPSAWAKAIEAAFREEASDGAGAGAPLMGVEVTVTDGEVHSNDSSERAFEVCARQALRQAVADAGTVVLEPVVRLVAEAPDVRPGVLLALVLARGGRVLQADDGAVVRIEAEISLARTFGFMSALRSATAGQGTFQMEPAGYRPA
jgi:elongation factor G